MKDKKVEPIYLVGNNALTLYLAAKLQDTGEHVIIISDKNDNLYLNTNGIILREDHSLQKKRHTFNTSLITKDKPKLTIISCDNHQLKYFLSSISINKIKDSPIILFSHLKDITHIDAVLGTHIIRGFIDGFISKDDQIVTLHGRIPSITLCPPKKDKSISNITALFEKTEIPALTSNDPISSFWNHFAPFAIASLSSAAFNEPLFELLQNKEKKETLKEAIKEISFLAYKEGIELEGETIEKRIYQTPNNYIFPLQISVYAKKNGDFTSICSNITNLAYSKKAKIPELSKFIAKIHNLILA